MPRRSPGYIANLLDAMRATQPTEYSPAGIAAVEEMATAYMSRSPELRQAIDALSAARHTLFHAALDGTDLDRPYGEVLEAAHRLAVLLRGLPDTTGKDTP